MSKLRYTLMAAISVLTLAILSGCQGFLNGQDPAPITTVGTPGKTTTASDAVYYTVQTGDSLYRIALKHGQSWEDVAQWNNITDPGALSVGTVLLVVPGGVAGPQAATGVTPPKTDTPTGSGVIQPLPGGDSVAGRMNWAWPAQGSVISRFGNAGNKGIDIAGQAGDPVLAAADGRVAYVGGDLQGYGNLVIVKHNDVFVTAYAHNQKILVQENQVVKRGDKIAEMGSTDANRVMLHFEIRQQTSSGSSAVDPMKYLPPR